MNILLAAKCPPNGPRKIGGVQSWCTTVASRLVQLGHVVKFWGPGQSITDEFDVGILANWKDVRPVTKFSDKRIFVCHGIIDAEEPPKNERVVYTSEGVRAFWKGTGPILRQPIDIDFWSPKSRARKYLTRFSYRKGLDFLPGVAKELGMRYQHVRNLSPERSREILCQSACVVATGRAALEAMACGVPVVIADDRSAYQRPLLNPSLIDSMSNNYSGRGKKSLPATRENTKEATLAVIKAGSKRDHVERFHDSRNVVNELMRVALRK